MSQLETGIQFHLPTLRHCTLAEILTAAEVAAAAGLSQLWVTDNLVARSAFVVLAALAARVPVKLGTAVMVPYFHNPVEAASALATISELMEGPELSIGISRGNPSTPGHIRTPKAISFVRETAQCLRRLLAGEAVAFRDYPSLASYFGLVPEAPFRLTLTPRVPARLYCGGNGPLSLAVGGQEMDGVIFGGSVAMAVHTGKVAPLLAIAEGAASAAGRGPLRKVAEIKISLSSSLESARAFARESLWFRAGNLPQFGYTNEDFVTLGVDPAAIARLAQAQARGASGNELRALVPETLIDAFFIAGDPPSCRPQVEELCDVLRAHGFHQVMFSGLGPDPAEAVRLLSREILPRL